MAVQPDLCRTWSETRKLVSLPHGSNDYYYFFQQHGSVYWKVGARKILNNLNTEDSLYGQLKVSYEGSFVKNNKVVPARLVQLVAHQA